MPDGNNGLTTDRTSSGRFAKGNPGRPKGARHKTTLAVEALLEGAQEQDRWTGFPEQREAILSALEGIPGVVWLSGDLHFAALTWVGQPGDLGQNQPEVLCGPSGSRRNPFPALYTGDRTQFPELLSEWNWVRFEADATLGTLRVQFIGDDGGTLADHTLSV